MIINHSKTVNECHQSHGGSSQARALQRDTVGGHFPLLAGLQLINDSSNMANGGEEAWRPRADLHVSLFNNQLTFEEHLTVRKGGMN